MGKAASKNLWDEAVASLNDEDQVVFDFSRSDKTAILEDILTAAEIKRQACMQKRWKFKRKRGDSIILRDVFEKLIKWVQKFKEIGDIVVQYDPGHATLPWAAVRFLLQLSINDVQTFGAMAEGLEVCSQSITRGSIIEALYLRETSPAKDNLQVALVRLYAIILRLLSNALRYYGRNTLVRASTSVLLMSDNGVEEYLNAIAAAHSQVQDWCQLIDAERQRLVLESNKSLQISVGAAQTALQSLFIDKDEQNESLQQLNQVLHSLEQPLQRVFDTVIDVNDNLAKAQRLELLHWMSTVPYRQHHRTSLSNALDQSGKWLQHHPTFKEWSSSSTSAVLWLHGIPGCGKTTLMSIIIEMLLKERTAASAPLAYFYCARDASEPRRADPEEVLRAVLKQISCNDSSKPIKGPVVREYNKRKLDAEEDGLEPSYLSVKYSTELILEVTEEVPAIIVIDALDECEPNFRYGLLNALETITENSSSIVKILVSSRDDADLKSRLEGFSNIEISSSDNQMDIERFVSCEIDQAIQDRRLLNGKVSPALREHLAKRLTNDAKGMFRWATLSIQNLCNPVRMKLASDVEDALNHLPETLAESYALIFEQIQQTEHEGRSVALHTLQWLLCAQVPLSVQQMVDLVSPPSRVLFSEAPTATDVLSVCCNLVVLDHELDCFRFAHVSVRDFFDGRKGFENDTVHKMALRQCLDFYDIDPLVVSPLPISPFQVRPSFQYAAKYWIVHYHCINAKNRTGSIKDRVQRFFIKELEVAPSFRFWMLFIWESIQLLDPHHYLTELLSSVVTDDPANPLFTACAFGLIEILVSLEIIEGLNWRQINRHSATGLHVAARCGFSKAVDFLLSKGALVDATNSSGQTAVHLAAQYGHVTTAQRLIEQGAKLTNKDLEDWTPLDNAMRPQNAQMVMLFLRKGAQAEAEAKYGNKIASWSDNTTQGVAKLRDSLGRPTGYIGILNEGQTGFLNTVLQILYMLRPVREIIDKCEDDDQTDGVSGIGTALRRLFDAMTHSKEVVSARDLTRALGWGSKDLERPQDAVNMMRFLLDDLERLPDGDSISDNFFQSFTKSLQGSICTQYKSLIMSASAEDHRYLVEDICFREEDGDFLYKLSGLAPVMFIEIKRYSYDLIANRVEKVHTYFEFPRILKFDEDLNVDSRGTSPIRYVLHGVMVHRGDLSGGKSYVFFKPRKDGQWIKFRNGHVAYATDSEAIEGTYGSDTPPENLATSCTAQGLIYLRETMLDELLYFA